MSTAQRFASLIGQLSVNYRREMTEAEIANFKLMAKKWGFDELERAAHEHMFDPDQGQYFPSIANISRFIVGTAKEQEKEVKGRAEIAWACVYDSIGRIGPYGRLKLEDKQALACVRALGGWVSLCNKTEEKLVWVKKEFLSMYDTFDGTPIEALPSNLPGLPQLKQHKAEQGEHLNNLLAEVQRRSAPAKTLPPASPETVAKGMQEIRSAAGQPTQQERKPSQPAASQDEIAQALADCEARKQERQARIIDQVKGEGDE